MCETFKRKLLHNKATIYNIIPSIVLEMEISTEDELFSVFPWSWEHSMSNFEIRLNKMTDRNVYFTTQPLKLSLVDLTPLMSPSSLIFHVPQ